MSYNPSLQAIGNVWKKACPVEVSLWGTKKADLGTLEVPGKQQIDKIKNQQAVETNAKTSS